MNKEEILQFKRDLLTAFENRAPNTTSLEIIRMVDRFDDANLRARIRPEFVEHANPERAWANAVINDDFEFNNQGSMMMILLTLAEHHEGFVPTEEQYEQLRDCDDQLEDLGKRRIFTLARRDDEAPNGMD